MVLNSVANLAVEVWQCIAPQTYTAVIIQDGDWWIGTIKEVSGVNCQDESRDGLLLGLRETLLEALALKSE